MQATFQSTSSVDLSFVDFVLGDETIGRQQAFDAYVAKWHASIGGLPELHAWLGLSFEEYSACVQDMRNLESILAERKRIYMEQKPSQAAIDYCNRVGVDPKWAAVYERVWDSLDLDLLHCWIAPPEEPPPPSPPWDGSLKRRRYWKKVQEK